MKDDSNSFQFDEFSAPIPGQSWTMAQGSMPMEHPPQFTDPRDALEFLFDKIVKPRQAERFLALLRATASCEAIARTTAFSGVALGKWTVDVAMLILRPTLFLICAFAERNRKNGLIKKFIIMEPDTEQKKFLSEVAPLEELEEDFGVEESDITKAGKDIKESGVDFSDLPQGMLPAGIKG